MLSYSTVLSMVLTSYQPAWSLSTVQTHMQPSNQPYRFSYIDEFVYSPNLPDSRGVQVVVFDLEFGQPAASSSLPASRPPFRDILGCFGHQAIGRDVTEGGIDLLCCSHQVCPNPRTYSTTRVCLLASKMLRGTAYLWPFCLCAFIIPCFGQYCP